MASVDRQPPDVEHDSDKDIILRWREGDPRAFEALILRWQPRMVRFLMSWVGEGTSVEDLCQEVFLRVFLGRSRYRMEGAFSTWIYHIARNVARDAQRKRKSSSRSSLEEEPFADPGLSVDSLCSQREIGELMAQALATLPESLRLVVVLRHYEKMTFADMARVLRVPASTLKSRFTLALTKLRQQLQERGWTPEDHLE